MEGQPWVDQARGRAAMGGSGEGVGQPQVANVSRWGR